MSTVHISLEVTCPHCNKTHHIDQDVEVPTQHKDRTLENDALVLQWYREDTSLSIAQIKVKGAEYAQEQGWGEGLKGHWAVLARARLVKQGQLVTGRRVTSVEMVVKEEE